MNCKACAELIGEPENRTELDRLREDVAFAAHLEACPVCRDDFNAADCLWLDVERAASLAASIPAEALRTARTRILGAARERNMRSPQHVSGLLPAWGKPLLTGGMALAVGRSGRGCSSPDAYVPATFSKYLSSDGLKVPSSSCRSSFLLAFPS